MDIYKTYDIRLLEGILERIREIKIKRHSSRIVDTLSESDLQLLLQANNELNSSQASKDLNTVIIYTSFFTGLRASELINLEINDINLIEDRLIVRQGKGNKDRQVGINFRLKPVLDKYINHQRPTSTSRRAFLLPDAKEISLNRLQKRIKYLFNKAGLKGLMHSLRRGCLTYYANRGVPLSQLQRIAGHSQIQTTLQYIQHEVEKIISSQVHW